MEISAVAVANVSQSTQVSPVATNDAKGNSVSNPDSTTDQVNISPAGKALAAQGASADPDHDGK